MKKIYLLFVLYIVTLFCYGQSVEVGFVKEYNGEKSKTPLAGVELSVKGAPSTISDALGHYELKFAVLKPGEAIKYNEIYKSGYIVFNKEAIESWRISNSQKPFVIVMCKESDFRELKKKFYGIIEKSYQDEYIKQKTIAEKMASDKANLETRLIKIEQEYKEKISNINTYVEIFARIDRNEMDSIRAKALNLMENGKIDEAIQTYDQINLTQKAEEQIKKIDAGLNAVRVGQLLLNESHQDLMATIETAKEKIGVYLMGGEKYNKERNKLIKQIISWYEKVNMVTEGQYNEELGHWMCAYADYTMPWQNRLAIYQQASALPSWHGLYCQARHLFLLSYESTQHIETAKHCLEEALNMELPDSIRTEVKNWLVDMPDFYSAISMGDTIYFKKNKQANTIAIWKKTPYLSNKVRDVVSIPSSVLYDGINYKITAIGEKAFCRNLHLKKMILPPSIHTIEKEAFAGCAIDTLIIEGGLQSIASDALPKTTYLQVPKKSSQKGWYINQMNRRDSIIKDNSEKEFNMNFQEIMEANHNATTREEQKKGRLYLLKMYVKVAQEIAKDEQLRLPQGLTFLEYEELVSIGIIAIQAMIKGKTLEQLEKYDDKYMSTAVKWAIRNEMRHRYDWYSYLSRVEIKEKTEDWDVMLAEKLYADTITKRVVGRIILFRGLRIIVEKTRERNVDYAEKWDNIMHYINRQPQERKDFLMEIVSGDSNIEHVLKFVNDAQKKYNMEKIELLQILKDMLKGNVQ